MQAVAQAGTGRGIDRPGKAVAADRADLGAGDDADCAMTEADQMVDRVGARRGVVDVDAGDAQIGAVFAAVDDRRGAPLAR